MKWNIGNKLGSLIAFAVIAFITLGTMTFIMIAKLNESISWDIHTRQVLHLNESIRSLLQDAETGQRGYIITGDEKYLEPFNSSKEIYDNFKEIVELTSDNPNQQKRLEKLKTLIDAKYANLQEAIDIRRANDFEAALKIVKTGEGKKIMDDYRTLAGEIENEENNLLTKRRATMLTDAANIKSIIVIGTLFSIILLSVVSFFVIRNISRPLSKVTKIADLISAGDLTSNLEAMNRSDEIGILNLAFIKMINVLRKMANAAQQIASGDLTGAIVPQSEKDILGNAFSQMLINLRQIMKDISEGVNLLGSSASEILAATTQVASGAAESATAISETTTTVEEVRQAAQLSSQKASNVSDNAQQVVQITKSGEKAVNETISGMHDIQKRMEAVANTIVRLSEQSQQIGGIIAAVTDVADQSNLLAVNAAIEAAKAGEHGKGFAVVAQEIKSLAQQSKQSTIQVRNILNDVQKATNAAVMATEQTSKAVENGVKQSNQAGDAIKKLADSANKAVEATLQIVASSDQQLVGMDQIGFAMQNINQAGTANAASMVKTEKAAKGLHELGQKLGILVNQYKI
ncbi:MAG TPA: CHASE3 domain-containing protein [Paludibacter sp.]